MAATLRQIDQHPACREAARRQWPTQGRQRRVALGLTLGLAAACVAVAPAVRAASAFVALGRAPLFPTIPTSGSPVALGRGEAVARRVSPYYSNADRERLARRRKETRMERRLPAPSNAPLNYDNLPAIEDIYNRQYTGNSTSDPIGGRKRYTYHVLFKPLIGKGGEEMRKIILEYMYFLKYKMSCRDIQVRTRTSPLQSVSDATEVGDTGESKDMKIKQVPLEYPMKEYGVIKDIKAKKQLYDRAILVDFDFAAPVKANDYIQKRFYKDNKILRFLVLGHTRTFKHLGEDNELHL